MTEPFRLETNRLILRSFRESDLVPFRLYRSDPEIARYQGWEAPYSLEKATQFLQEMIEKVPGEPGQWYQIALELKNSGKMIGDCAFQRLAEEPRQAEIAFTLARAYQGFGYATEALKYLMGYLFDHYGLHRIRANCDPENVASARLLERLGMRREGRFVESLWYKGAWVSEDWYAIIDREWGCKG